MKIICKAALAAGFIVLAISGHAPAQAEQPAAKPEDKPAEAPVASAFQIIRLPDGRQAIVFKDDNVLPLVSGDLEKITLPDGRTAYVAGSPADGAIPYWATPIVKSIADKPATWKTGEITAKEIILTVPFTYKKTFRVKTDFSIKPAFSKDLKLFAKAGTVGFYSGAYRIQKSHGALGGNADMLCLFREGQKVPYKDASCYLRMKDATPEAHWFVANTYGVMPTQYSVTTNYGIPLYTAFGPIDIETGDFPIPHDFTLNLVINKWGSKGVWVEWRSGDDGWAKNEFMTPDKDGKLVFPVQGGELWVRPHATDKKKSLVEFKPDAAAQP